jgi:uncharacterized protein
MKPSLQVSAADRTALSEFVSRLRSALGGQWIEVRLFGSKARGDARPDSDLDVLVVIDAPARWPPAKTISDIAFEVNLAHDVFISPVVITSAALADDKQAQSPFIRAVQADSVPL